MCIAAAASRLAIERNRADQRRASPPAIGGARPTVNQTIGDTAVSPNRPSEKYGKAVDRAPASNTAAELFELPSFQMRKRCRMMINQFVSDEAVGHLRDVDKHACQFEDDVR